MSCALPLASSVNSEVQSKYQLAFEIISVGLHPPRSQADRFLIYRDFLSRPARFTKHKQNYAPNALSMVPASLTSNFPGASTLTAFTTPSSTSNEKRCARMPMPRGVRSFSRPSFFT